ncbi:MAG: PD40 domain-containing protein [Bacteroidetes bacterium]|nr:PD40 domain-containing protein [Bacteroidota bacterium]
MMHRSYPPALNRIFCCWLAAGLLLAPASARAQRALGPVNTAGDDYALALRPMPWGSEVWFTRSVTGSDDRRIMISRYDNAGWHEPVEAPAPVNQEHSGGVHGVALDGAPAFAPCVPGLGVFVSNRPGPDGRRHGSDLYELRADGTQWSVRRIDENGLNSEEWDDTPALSDDGNTLYFSSNRRAPERGETDLYMSRRTGDRWGAPVLLSAISEDGVREQTPCVGPDGWLYFASDRSGDFDIWRVRLDARGMPVPGTRQPAPGDGLGLHGSDELHPAFSPGGGWMFFASNRAASHRYDIYSVPAASRSSAISLMVLERTRRELNGRSGQFADETLPLSNARVVRTELPGGATDTLNADADGRAALDVHGVQGDDPLGDRSARTYVVRAIGLGGAYVSSTDTLIIRSADTCARAHTLFVWDTTVLYDPGCRQDFAVQQVEFFVKGYWCPTTLAYARYTPCYSVLTPQDCDAVPDADQTTGACGDNALYRHTLVPARVTTARRPDLCIRWSEVRDSSQKWSLRVDSVVAVLLENMRSAMRNYCVEQSFAEGKRITVTVQGWTDPDPIDPACYYTDQEVRFGAGIEVADPESKPWIRDGVIPAHTPFHVSKPDGNPMLSTLRAYYMAKLLDGVWREKLPEYASARDRGLIRIVADGRSVSQRNLPKQLQRSIDVIVTAVIEPEKLLALRMHHPGGSYDLRCGGCP